MRDKIWFYFIFINVRTIVTDNLTEEEHLQNKYALLTREHKHKCWRSFRAHELLQFMEKIDKEYAITREDAQKYLDKTNFTKRILEKILVDRNLSLRDSPDQGRYHAKIPSGIKLGGQCIMTLPNIVLFFHHMKLSNDTFFEIKNLHNNVKNMILKGQFLLFGLHLTGPYDSSIQDKGLSLLKHIPSLGELRISLEDVRYTMEGLYRFNKDRLVIELIVSTLDTGNITLMHTNANKTEPPILLDKQDMGDFMTRLKCDLDKWMQDYFNQYLAVTILDDVPSISKLQEYDLHKYHQLAKFTDNALIKMNKMSRDIGRDTVYIPQYKFTTSHNLSIEIFAGALRGLDTMYRKSKPTTLVKNNNVRHVDAIIGFRDLKVSYAYKMIFPPGQQIQPSLTGVLTMSAKQQIGHLALKLLKDVEDLQLDLDFLSPIGADTITVVGDTDILMLNFKHMLHHEIATVMSNSLRHSVELFKSLLNCDPFGIPENVLPISDIKINIIKVQPNNQRREALIKSRVEQLRKTSKMIPT